MRNLAIGLLAIALLAGCTTKKNHVGYEETDVQPLELNMTNPDFLLNCTSYQDTANSYTSNPYATVGHSHGSTAVALMWFTDVPDTNNTNCRLVLYPTDLTHAAGMTLRMGLLKQEWDEDEVTWFEAQDDDLWDDPANKYDVVADWSYTVPEGDADSLVIPLPASLLEKWGDDDDDNYGLALFSDDNDRFIEWHTLYNSDECPELRFFYTYIDTPTIQRDYEMNPVMDATIFNKPTMDILDGQMEVTSAVPERLFLDYDLSYDAMQQSGANFTDEYQYKHTTVNRAELIIPVDTGNTYFYGSTASVYALLVYGESPSVPVATANLKAFTYTDVSYLNSGNTTIAVDITPMAQAIMAGKYPNKGFVIKCYYESRDFTHIRFNTEGVKLHMTYTLPYAED
jgi:hypothetical protein